MRLMQIKHKKNEKHELKIEEPMVDLRTEAQDDNIGLAQHNNTNIGLVVNEF